MKYLVVTADDFGLTGSINEGIASAVREGIVRAVGLLPSGDAFLDAVERAGELGLQEAGAHLSLTETRPTLKGGKFYKGRMPFLTDLLLGRIRRDDIYSELKNQMEMLRKAGIKITNLTSHEHLHMIPSILDIFIRLAREYDVPSIRFLRREKRSSGFSLGGLYRAAVISCFENGIGAALHKAGIKYTDHFLGFRDSGNLTEEIIVRMLGSLESGTTELVCHPGFLGPEVLDRYKFHLNCERELSALTSPAVKKAVEEEGVRLISYSDYVNKV